MRQGATADRPKPPNNFELRTIVGAGTLNPVSTGPTCAKNGEHVDDCNQCCTGECYMPDIPAARECCSGLLQHCQDVSNCCDLTSSMECGDSGRSQGKCCKASAVSCVVHNECCDPMQCDFVSFTCCLPALESCTGDEDCCSNMYCGTDSTCCKDVGYYCDGPPGEMVPHSECCSGICANEECYSNEVVSRIM